jgi:predicted DNA-binding ribbon-helix-helix protein
MCQRAARIDGMLRVTIYLLTYWWNCLREVEERDKI